jgi:hypothetical protein
MRGRRGDGGEYNGDELSSNTYCGVVSSNVSPTSARARYQYLILLSSSWLSTVFGGREGRRGLLCWVRVMRT